MTAFIKADLPLKTLSSWMNNETIELMKAALVSPHEASEDDPVAFYVDVDISNHGVSGDPVVEVILGSSRRQRIIERSASRADLALAALALQSDPGLSWLMHLASEIRDYSALDPDEVKNAEIYIFPNFSIVFGDEDESWHSEWEGQEEEALIEDYLPSCVLGVVQSGISQHEALFIEQEMAAALRIAEDDIRQVTSATADPFRLTAPRLKDHMQEE
jgi:hypothetical protein